MREAKLSKRGEANTKYQEKIEENQDAVERLLKPEETGGQFGEAGCRCYSGESNSNTARCKVLAQ